MGVGLESGKALIHLSSNLERKECISIMQPPKEIDKT
jgi:hypothetical protein